MNWESSFYCRAIVLITVPAKTTITAAAISGSDPSYAAVHAAAGILLTIATISIGFLPVITIGTNCFQG